MPEDLHQQPRIASSRLRAQPRPQLGVGFGIGGIDHRRHIEELHLAQLPQHRTILAHRLGRLDRPESEAGSPHFSGLDLTHHAPRVGILVVNFDFIPQAALVLIQHQVAGAQPAQGYVGVMVEEAQHVRLADGLGKRPAAHHLVVTIE